MTGVRIRVAWSLAVLALLCATADTVFTALRAPLLSADVWTDHGWPMVTGATLGCALMGALIVSRQPRHPVGWLLVVAGTSCISVSAEAYYLWALDGAGHGPAAVGHFAGWLSGLFGAPLAMTAVLFIYLIAPDGRLPSPRWRWVGGAAIVGLVAYTASVAAQSPLTFDLDQNDARPRTTVLSSVGVTLMIVALIVATVGLGIRVTRARGEVRRQLLWIAASAVLLALSFAWLLVALIISGGRQGGAAVIVLFIAYLSVPVTTAVAVLRHRLFEIDLIVNRALVLFFATGFVAGAYVLLVVALGAQVNGRIGFWPSLLATALVAVAFQPLRRSVVRAADRLAFGAAAEPYEALAEFSRRLGESPDPSDLLPAVADAAAGAVGARRATVELDLPFGEILSATAPVGAQPGSGPSAQIPVMDGAERLGVVTVEMPPGRAVRGPDEALLRDLADQALVAFRNAGLAAELEHRVAELDRQAVALEDSRRRLITAGDAERRRLEAAVTRDVTPYLEPMPARMRAVARLGSTAVSAADVQRLRAAVESALEALREITRGVYPAQLGRAGLEPALRSLIARTPDARLLVDGEPELARSDSRVEAAAYFCVAEALRVITGPIEVTVARTVDEVVVAVVGVAAGELPLPHMRDRVEALDGSVVSRRSADRLLLELRLPAGQPVPVTA